MKRMTVYWCDGEYMTASKVRRIKRKEGFDFDRAFSKSVYVETLGDKLSRLVKKVAYYGALVVLTAALLYILYRMGCASILHG